MWDAQGIVADMREADREELLASSGTDTYLTVARGIARSVEPIIAEDETGPLCVFGYVHLHDGFMTGEASPWLIGTNRLLLYPRLLTQRATRYIEVLQEEYAVLSNYVDTRNVLAKRWLTRLGFTVQESTVPFGLNGEPFHYFERRRHV